MRCNWCGRQEETFLHCLRDCEQPQRIWSSLGVTDASFMQVTDHKHWVHFCLQCLDACVIFAAIWWIWRGRNHHVFNGANMEESWILRNIAHDVDAYKSNPDIDSVVGSNPRWIRWIWPRDGIVKLNVDGCSKGNPGRARIGGLLKGGQWLFGFIGFIGVIDNLLPKLMAI